MGVTDQTPYGLLRKVTNVTKGGKDGSQVIVETEFASLEEAIEQGSFEFDITLEPEDIEKSISYPKGVRLIEDKFETGYSFSYELDKVLCNNHLIIDGELSFDYHILFDGTLGFFKLKTLEFKNTVTSKAELDVTLTDSFSVGDLLDDNPKTIFTIPFKSITVWVSYVPIVLKPQIDINTISQEDEGAYVAGVEFDNGTWEEIKDEPVFSFEYREPSLSADAKIKAYAGPQLELMLYGIAGPHCNIYGYLDFEADIWDDPWWELYAGLDVTAGLQLEIITKFWSATYSSPEFDIINYRTPEPIAQADGSFNHQGNIVEGGTAIPWTFHEPENSPQDIIHEINTFWDVYQGASGYKLYRKVNNGNWNLIFQGEGEVSGENSEKREWHDQNIQLGNSYEYYVVACGEDWETKPNFNTGSLSQFLPPIYLNSPSDQSTVSDSNATFQWTPLGGIPAGFNGPGNTKLQLYDVNTNELIWHIWFNDATTSSVTFNQDGQATAFLIPGHTYGWRVRNYAYDQNIEDVITQSEYWEFTYTEGE